MNKFFGKKGQGAMEYLMTYGWAILVVMIVGVVLWQLGIFNLGGTVSKTMSGFGAVKPLDWSLTPAVSNDNVVLVNGEGTKVTLKSISFSGDCVAATITANVAGTTIDAGDTKSIPTVAADICPGTAPSANAGSSYKVTLTISYNKTIGTVTQDHSSVGTLRGVWE